MSEGSVEVNTGEERVNFDGPRASHLLSESLVVAASLLSFPIPYT